MGAYAGTVQFHAGVLRFLLALGFIVFARKLLKEPGAVSSWHAVGAAPVRGCRDCA